MPIKSFRGKIADNGVQVVPISTNDGSMGYRIVKFSLMAIDPMGNNQESVVKIYTVPQPNPTVTPPTSTIDFADNTLLAAGYLESDNSGATPTFNEAAIIFDNMIFNQDIYITHVEQGSDAVNYYIELEQIKLDLNSNTVATLKDIRNIKSQ
jgi:hypothetical protein